jgi:alkaline phosphatase
MLTERRKFLQTLLAGAAGATLPGAIRAAAPVGDTFSFGVITDLHYAEIPPKGKRYCADSRAKLDQALATFAARHLPLVVELGDLIDAGPNQAADLGYLKTIRASLAKYPGQQRFVLGNHCVWTISKDEFLAGWGSTGVPTYYSFDQGGWHFVVLDGDFRRDGTAYDKGNFHWTDSWIPDAQQQWLADDLRRAGARPSVVLIHQNLQDSTLSCGVKNAHRVRKILEAAGNVKAVLQGHLHEGASVTIAGIPYFTFKAAVEGPGLDNNAYAIVSLGPGDRVSVEGFGRQPSQRLR